jgi:hypothetical protein
MYVFDDGNVLDVLDGRSSHQREGWQELMVVRETGDKGRQPS